MMIQAGAIVIHRNVYFILAGWENGRLGIHQKMKMEDIK